MQVTVEPGIECPRVGLINGKFQITVATKNEAEIHKAMEEWYKQKALEKIGERVKLYQNKFHVKHHGSIACSGLHCGSQDGSLAGARTFTEVLGYCRCGVA